MVAEPNVARMYATRTRKVKPTAGTPGRWPTPALRRADAAQH
jgi:hypothetical protein